MTIENQFATDLWRAVQALPLGAVSMAAGLLCSQPGVIVSAAERDFLHHLLADHGDAAPTLAQELLLQALRAPDARQSTAWAVLCKLGREIDAVAAVAFQNQICNASVMRWRRHYDRLTGSEGHE